MAIIDWVFLGLYFVLLIVIGLQTIRRIETPEDFAVAGNRIIWPVFFGSLAAAFLGGGSSLGNAGETFTDGYVYMFAFFAFAIQTVLVGYFVAPRLKRYADAQTVGDIMENHYGSTARLLTGILSVGVCAGILGAQALAVGTIFNTILGISTTLGILIGMSIVVLYSAFGGVWAVIQTDMLQFVFLGVFLPVTLIIGLIKVGGPAELAASVPDAHLSFMGTWTLGLFASVFLAFLLGETLVPPYTQRAFSTPDPANARKGYVMSGIFELGGRDLSVNRRLLESVLRSAAVFLRDWVMEEPRFEWAGMRPTTPDDLPLIGAVPGFEHLYVATGHGMLGVTLAPATAAALAPLVLEDHAVPELEPFRLDRFAGGGAKRS